MLRPLIAMFAAFCLFASLVAPASAQQAAPAAVDRSKTGGAQALEDILARQRGENIDDSFRRNKTGDPASTADIAGQLGTLGGASDPDLWRAMRYNSADVTASSGGELGQVLVQSGGMRWYQLRRGPLVEYGGTALLVTIGALALFYLLRGRVRVEAGMAGRTVTRFQAVERFAHWLLAGSFVLLALTGLANLLGRQFIAPLIGREATATMLAAGKFVHDNVAWAFMLGLVMVFLLWVRHNLPSLTDIGWILKGGGIIGSAHPPAGKFNAGQKMVFWSVILLGGLVSLFGLSLLFPFEIPVMERGFALVNATGLPAALGWENLPTPLAPQEDMQLAQLAHAILAFAMMVVILAHIYIGTLGMEGALEAMSSGEVDEAWARQHHSIWYDEVKTAAPDADAQTTAAE